MRTRMSRLKYSWPVIFFLVACILTACSANNGRTGSSNNAPAAPAANQIFTYPIQGASDINTLDPALAADLQTEQPISMMYTGLVQLDRDLKVQPQMASSWNVSADRQTWTFHLRPNLRFSDGTPITSKEIAYSIDRALRKDTNSPLAISYLGLIKDSDKLNSGMIKTIIGDSLLIPNPQTIIILTSHAAAYFLNALTYSTSYIIEPSMYEKYGASFVDHLSEGGGTGPFKLQSYSHTTGLVLVPNPYYYGPKPILQKVILPFMKNSATSYKAYEAGQVDLTKVPSDEYERAKTNTQEFHRVELQSIFYYSMNYLKPPFDNIHIRQAFALAINKQAIVHSIWKDKYIATNHIVPTGTGDYDNSSVTGPDETQSLTGNKALARSLLQQGLQEKGWSSVSQMPEITFYYRSDEPEIGHEIAAVTQMWRDALGVNVRTESVNFNVLLDTLNLTNTNSPRGISIAMWQIGWSADYPDPQDWLTLQFGKGQQNDSSNYGDSSLSPNVTARQQSIQKLMTLADAENDHQARMNDYVRAEQSLVNDVAWLPMYQSTEAYLLKPNVAGFPFTSVDIVPPNEWGNVYITQ